VPTSTIRVVGTPCNELDVRHLEDDFLVGPSKCLHPSWEIPLCASPPLAVRHRRRTSSRAPASLPQDQTHRRRRTRCRREAPARGEPEDQRGSPASRETSLPRRSCSTPRPRWIDYCDGIEHQPNQIHFLHSQRACRPTGVAVAGWSCSTTNPRRPAVLVEGGLNLHRTRSAGSKGGESP